MISTLETVEEDRVKCSRNVDYEDEVKVLIPFKLIGMQEALEKNFDWIMPENPFDENSVPKNSDKGNYETFIDSICCIIEKVFKLSLKNSGLGNT